MSIKFVASACLVHPANTSTRAFTLTALIPRNRFHTCSVLRLSNTVFMRAFQLTFKRSRSAEKHFCLIKHYLQRINCHSIILRFVLIKTFIPSRGPLRFTGRTHDFKYQSFIANQFRKPNGSIIIFFIICA